jgi:hypothetical protein
VRARIDGRRAKCEECGDLQSHEFRSPDDLLDALRVAALEVDRGVLRRADERNLNAAEQEAMDSVSSHALPGTVRYRFCCNVCGDRFELVADTSTGEGGWQREEAAP